MAQWPTLCEEVFGLPLWPDARGASRDALPGTVAELAARSGLTVPVVIARIRALMEHAVALEITPIALKALLDEDASAVCLIDVREPWETALCHLPGSRLLHAEADLGALWRHAEAAPHVVVVCHHGVRSHGAALALREQGLARAQSLAGGLEAWALAVDPAMARY